MQVTPLDALGLCYIHTVHIPRETMRVKKQIFVHTIMSWNNNFCESFQIIIF